jgi:hypothetical protein
MTYADMVLESRVLDTWRCLMGSIPMEGRTFVEVIRARPRHVTV